MNGLKSDYLVWLQGERISLKRLINIARRANDLRAWDDLDAQWAARFTELVAFIESGQLRGVLRRTSRLSSVCLPDLWEFLSRRPYPIWDWLREFCRQWSDVAGIPLDSPNSATTVATNNDEEMTQGRMDAWYVARRDDLLASGKRSGRDDDYAAAKEKFGRPHTKFVTRARDQLAPPEWSDPGRRKSVKK